MQEVDKDSLTKDRSRKVCLTLAMYNKIFEYISLQDSSVVHRDACPVPLNSPGVLLGWAKAIWSIQCDGFNIMTTKPQNCVVAKVNWKTVCGIVQQLYTLVDHMGVLRYLF
ncbi:hypothetical protein VP01_1770g4 [Puccinia sorghi]|uniref:Uncharacterized protein n=1 Tax=Puccinia sorghi TaxID=27349 RepID=A0A0L6VEU1_9BASI|nr:hypothetical protein VP01_1770g4 [Puccinia sorghi]